MKNGPLAYSLDTWFMEYYCRLILGNSKNNYKSRYGPGHFVGDETGDFFYIRINDFGRFAVLEADFLADNKQVYQLTNRIGELDGFPLYAGSWGNELEKENQFSRTILVARSGQLPYCAVTRKQYLITFLK